MTDPYRPAPPAFPRARLQRAGLDADAVDRAETEWEAQDDSGRAGFASWVVANSDDAIRDRYAQPSTTEAPGETGQPEQPAAEPQPAQPVEQPAADQSAPAEQQTPEQAPQEPAEEPATGPTYEELNALTIDQLDARIGEWNTAHPDGPHLIVSGRKGEKIGRLLDAYESEQGDAFPAAPPETTEPPATPVAEQQVPAAPTATSPDGAPAAEAPAAAGFVPPPGTVEPPAGAQEPAQTADAAPGADAAPTEE